MYSICSSHLVNLVNFLIKIPKENCRVLVQTKLHVFLRMGLSWVLWSYQFHIMHHSLQLRSQFPFVIWSLWCSSFQPTWLTLLSMIWLNITAKYTALLKVFLRVSYCNIELVFTFFMRHYCIDFYFQHVALPNCFSLNHTILSYMALSKDLSCCDVRNDFTGLRKLMFIIIVFHLPQISA